MARAVKEYVQIFEGGNSSIKVKKDGCEEIDETSFRCVVSVTSEPQTILDGSHTFKFQRIGEKWNLVPE